MRASVNGYQSHDLRSKTRNTCDTCLSSLLPLKRERHFCSDKCRLLHWALKEIIKEFKAGKANGLKGLIKELAEVKR